MLRRLKSDFGFLFVFGILAAGVAVLLSNIADDLSDVQTAKESLDWKPVDAVIVESSLLLTTVGRRGLRGPDALHLTYEYKVGGVRYLSEKITSDDNRSVGDDQVEFVQKEL